MSTFTVVECEYKDRECIQKALDELGYTWEYHEEAQSLYGYQGDVRSQKANIIVRRKYVGNLSNDIGFLRNADGTYQLIISEFDASQRKTRQKIMVQMKQVYSKHMALKTLKNTGCVLTDMQQTNKGQIRIRARVM